jgi:hypothetical protein
VGSSSILVKNSYLDINKKNRNDQEPGTILTGIFTEKGFINKNVSLKKIITKNDEEPNCSSINPVMGAVTEPYKLSELRYFLMVVLWICRIYGLLPLYSRLDLSFA